MSDSQLEERLRRAKEQVVILERMVEDKTRELYLEKEELRKLNETLEDKVALRTAELTESELKLSLTLESIREAVLMLDSEDKILLANQQAFTMLEITKDSAIGSSFELAQSVELQQEWQKVKKTDSNLVKYRFTQFSREKKRVFEISRFRINREDAFGSKLNSTFVCVIQDITEISKVDELKRKFLSVVSHELRTPLMVLRSSHELAEKTKEYG